MKMSFKQIYYVRETDEFIVGSWVFGKSDCYAYRFNGNELTEVYHFANGSTQCRIGEKVYFTDQTKLYRYERGTVKAIKEFSPNYFAGNAWGWNEKNFFTVVEDGLGHYNGTDIQTVFKKWEKNWAFNGGIVFEDDVFVIWQKFSNDLTISIHGKINK